MRLISINFWLFLFLFLGLNPSGFTQNIKGFHFAIPENLDKMDLDALENIHANTIALVPFGFMEDYDSVEITGDFQTKNWMAEDSIRMDIIRLAKAKQIAVLMKPHLYLNHPTKGKWRAEIQQKTYLDWMIWEENYRDFILYYARFCEKMEVETLCIGMELTEIVRNHSGFWRELIESVRAVYSGKLVYAANWYEEYELVDFWDDLDYIGLQAYFPLTEKENPTIETLKLGWEKQQPILEKLATDYNKPILLTEIGYKSTTDAAIEPWQWPEDVHRNYIPSEQTQSNCYEAFFQTIWKQTWLAGAFFWQWQGDLKANHIIDFSPQGKKAETVIQNWFDN